MIPRAVNGLIAQQLLEYRFMDRGATTVILELVEGTKDPVSHVGSSGDFTIF